MTSSHTTHRGLITLCVVVLVLATGIPAATAQNEIEPAFIVEVQADGSAEVIVRSTFDLTTDSEQEAFQTLIDDQEAQQTAIDRFRNRMQSVANDASNATGREMRITDASIDLRRSADNETGIVSLSVTWEGLAAAEGDALVVTEPFASGFTPDRPFVLTAPDGYVITSVTPDADTRNDDRVTWNSGSDLSGFTVELEPEPTPTAEPAVDDEPTETDGQPGFGLLSALLGILVITIAVTIRRGGRRDREGGER